MEAEHHAQLGVPDVPCDESVDRTIELGTDQFGQYPDHAPEGIERNAQQPVETDGVQIGADLEEALVAGDIVRIEAGNLGLHGVVITAVVEMAAVVETDSVIGRDLAQVDVVRHPPPAQRPELFEQERRGDDRGSGVEREAVLAIHVGATARGVESLADRDPVAARAEPDGGRETTETAADYDGLRLLVHSVPLGIPVGCPRSGSRVPIYYMIGTGIARLPNRSRPPMETETVVHLFEALVIVHILTGSVGLICVWVPIIGKKGGRAHKRWGKVFAYSMLITGSVAIGISLCTLHSPLATHPFSDDEPLVRGLFGWMMLYLATLTIMLAWYGLLCIRNKERHGANKNAVNIVLQILTFAAAANCALHGIRLENGLMIGISIVGLTAAVLNTRFIFRREPPLNEWLIQHTRGLVGAGISVYTAFLAFGAVNLLPAYAFNPFVWSTPTVLGVGLLLYHQNRIMSQRRRLRLRQAAASVGD